jgi:hypothetical protein
MVREYGAWEEVLQRAQADENMSCEQIAESCCAWNGSPSPTGVSEEFGLFDMMRASSTH